MGGGEHIQEKSDGMPSTEWLLKEYFLNFSETICQGEEKTHFLWKRKNIRDGQKSYYTRGPGVLDFYGGIKADTTNPGALFWKLDEIMFVNVPGKSQVVKM